MGDSRYQVDGLNHLFLIDVGEDLRPLREVDSWHGLSSLLPVEYMRDILRFIRKALAVRGQPPSSLIAVYEEDKFDAMSSKEFISSGKQKGSGVKVVVLG